MENAVKKQTVKVEKAYVKLSDMQAKNILALPSYRANLIKQRSKRRQVYYRLSVELHHLLKIERTLQEKEFNLIVLERKMLMDKPIQGLLIPVRLVKGKTSTDREWYRYEMFVSKNFVLTGFLDDTDVALMKAGSIDFNWIESEERFEDELVNTFSKEDYE